MTLVPASLGAAARLAAIGGEFGPIDDPVERILGAVREHLGMEIAFVSRYVENDQREFTHISTDLPLPHRPGFREPQEESFCYHILEGRLPGLIHDAADHPLALTLPITSVLPVGCHLNVPLRFSDGTAYGSFCALSRKPDRSINQRDMGILSAFATLAVEQIERTVGTDMESSRIRKRIEDVLENRALTIFHQPIVSLETGRPVGVECLARFPDSGVRGPDAWFTEAASVGLGIELEMLAVELAMESLHQLPRDLYASINASPECVLSERLEERFTGNLRDRLVVEVTEHAQVDDYASLAIALRHLRRKVRIAIDDVGAGYAGLRHIVDLSPDLLKLDMSLTRNIHCDAARHALSGAMVRFAYQIGARIVAEGIENAEEFAALRSLGVDYGQGYMLGRPMPVADPDCAAAAA